MFGRVSQVRHFVAIAGLLAGLVLLLATPLASANFVYWTNQSPGSTIGRAKINGTALNDNFIAGLTDPHGVAVDSKFIYWAQGDATTGSIGRANLDGTGANPNFIPHSAGVSNPMGVAVTTSGLYWAQGGSIGHANLDGSGANSTFVPVAGLVPCGLAADSNNVYWLDTGLAKQIGRARLDGSGPQPGFISLPNAGCGPAVDSNYLYWSTATNSVGRAPVGGGSLQPEFIPSPGPGFSTTGVAVQSQYVFWANNSGVPNSNNFIGRANLSGSNPNQTLISGLADPGLMAAAPSNKITINSVTRKKKKGTAAISVKVPGPGQVTLNQVSTPPDVNATAAAVKQIGLTIPQASSFTVPVKPVGKTAKKLKKQIKKQLRKKRKAKARAKVSVFIHFVPAGVAGVPNTQQVSVTLIKQSKKKHR